MAREARVHRIAAGGPDDMSGLTAAVQRGDLDPAAIVAILGKTEGNGCVNDFTRGFATASLTRVAAPAARRPTAAEWRWSCPAAPRVR